MMWWAVLCAVLVASAGAAAVPSRETLEQLEPYDLVQIEPRPPAPEDTDSDLVSFGISPSGDRFMPNNPWHTHGEPREIKDLISYGLSPSGDRFMPNNPWHTHGEPREAKRQTEGRSRPKRKMPSLSINNPMEVLRQRLMLEVARKQMREASQRQAVANRVFLQNVGKRGFWQNSEYSQYDN